MLKEATEKVRLIDWDKVDALLGEDWVLVEPTGDGRLMINPDDADRLDAKLATIGCRIDRNVDIGKIEGIEMRTWSMKVKW